MAITINGTNGIREDLESGCYVGDSLGIYMGETIQRIAIGYGFDREFIPCGGILSDDCAHVDHSGEYHGEAYDDATSEAEDFLNGVTSGGSWGFSDGGFFLLTPEQWDESEGF